MGKFNHWAPAAQGKFGLLLASTVSLARVSTLKRVVVRPSECKLKFAHTASQDASENGGGEMHNSSVKYELFMIQKSCYYS